MKIAYYESQGAARDVLRLGEMAPPEPKEGEVLVRIRSSGVNPVDGYVRAGALGPSGFPRIVPGLDGAGLIEAVGPGVRRQPGERVWVYNAQWQRAFGTAAELVALPESQVVNLPDAISFEEGAALGVAARTAHAAVFSDGPVAGKTVLVAGGAGATANAAIQLAKWKGARVVTTVSSDEKARAAARAGADHILRYDREDVAEVIFSLTAGAGVDHIVEVALGANFDLDAKVLGEGGVISAYGSPGRFTPAFPMLPLLFKRGRVHLINGFARDDRALEDIGRALIEGALRPQIWARYRLEDIAEAHEAQDAGRPVGKIVLTVS
jgi:NADPH2:quinone reductase